MSPGDDAEHEAEGGEAPQTQRGKGKGGEAEDAAAGAGEAAGEQRFPPPTLLTHVFHLASQVGIALGDTENPITGKREIDLRAARFLIDTLAMLEKKTAGNRNEDEEQYLEGVLANLRLAYVKKTGGKP